MLRHKSLHPLSHQHHDGLALCTLTERSLVSDTTEANIRRLAGKAVDRFDLELTNHFELEERELFPAIAAELGEMPLVAELIGEHRQMEEMVAALREAPSESRLRAFVQLLRGHIRREENELFEEVQVRLRPETLDRLGVEFAARAVRVCLEP